MYRYMLKKVRDYLEPNKIVRRIEIISLVLLLVVTAVSYTTSNLLFFVNIFDNMILTRLTRPRKEII